MEKRILHRYLGQIASITTFGGQIHIGKLGYTPPYCSRLGFQIPEGYYIGDFHFKAEDVKIISTVWEDK